MSWQVLSARWTMVVISIVHSLFSAAQIAEPCVHHQRNEALKAFDAQSPALAIERFTRYQEQGGRLNAYDLLCLARSYMDLDDTAQCFTSLQLGITKGLDWSELENHLSIEHAFTTAQRSVLNKDRVGYDHLRQQYLTRLDTVLIRQVAELFNADQKIRSERSGSSEQDHRRRIFEQDSITRKEVFAIFDRYGGFPPDSIIDRKATFSLSLLIHHIYRTFPEDHPALVSIVVKAIDLFDLHPNEYAVMMDRHQYMIDGSIIYGEVPKSIENGSSVEHVRDPGTVDELRFAVGLGSLKEFCMDRGCVLPANYIELPSPCE